jgi:hypothetical protein
MKVYNKNGELVGLVDSNDEIVEVTANERETMNNLLAELESIACAVRICGGVWYGEKDEKVPSRITHLVVTANGSIAAAGFRAPYYSINPVYLEDGFPIVEEGSCDGSLMGSEDPAIMLDPEKWQHPGPAYMLYSIDGESFNIRRKEEMLRRYQETLDDTEGEYVPGIESAQFVNSHYRIGGKYFEE